MYRKRTNQLKRMKTTENIKLHIIHCKLVYLFALVWLLFHSTPLLHKSDKFAIYLYAGPVLSIGAASRTNVSVNINLVQLDGIYDNYSGVLKDLKFPGSDRLTSAGEKQELMDAIQAELDAQGLTQRRFDLQFDWGVGFRFKGHWELRTGYSFGLIDRYNGTFTRNYNLMMNQYYIGFGYRF